MSRRPAPPRGRRRAARLAVGVDGCSQGWIAVALDGDAVRASVHARFTDLVRALPADAAIGVDMPIGLVARGWRTADLAVRTFLGARRASLFVIPPRPVIGATDYATACRRAARLTGHRISRQAFALFAKIRELDAHVADPRLLEVHPETSFALMAGAPLADRKRSWAGVAARRELLARHGIALPARFRTPADAVGVDDVLDAAAAAWTARRWLRGVARAFPPDPADRDASGRAIVVHA